LPYYFAAPAAGKKAQKAVRPPNRLQFIWVGALRFAGICLGSGDAAVSG